MTDFDALLLSSEEPFALGAADYWDTHPDLRDIHPRIYVRFLPEGIDTSLSFLALLDTGAHYCILNPETVDLISANLTGTIGSMKLQTARGLVRGTLHRHSIYLLAEKGTDLKVDATLFVSPDWRGPNFLGYTGVLDRMRFAIHPVVNRFYFGPQD